MTIAGFKCGKDKVEWTIISGDRRSDADAVEFGVAKMPKDERSVQLHWLRKEILELLDRHMVEAASFMSAGAAASFGRAECEGVLQEVFGSRPLPIKAIHSATVRSKFRVKNNAQLDVAIMEVPILSRTPKSRRDPVLAACCLMV